MNNELILTVCDNFNNITHRFYYHISKPWSIIKYTEYENENDIKFEKQYYI